MKKLKDVKNSYQKLVKDMAMGKFEILPKLDSLCEDLKKILDTKKRKITVRRKNNPDTNFTINFDDYFSYNQNQFKGQLTKLLNITNKTLTICGDSSKVKQTENELIQEFNDLKNILNQSVYDINTNDNISEIIRTKLKRKLEKSTTIMGKLFENIDTLKNNCILELNKVTKR